MAERKVDYFDPGPITNPARALYLLVEQFEDSTRRYLEVSGGHAGSLYIERYERRSQKGGVGAKRNLCQSGETNNYLSRVELYMVDLSVTSWLIETGYVERVREFEEKHLCHVNGRYKISARGVRYIPAFE